MKQILLLLALVLAPLCSVQGQKTANPKQEPKPEKCNAVVVKRDSCRTSKDKRGKGFVCALKEVMPSFPGGQDSLKAFIFRNLRYPDELAEGCVQGRVICTFVVNEDGTCTDFKVIRSVHPALDEEALRVLRLMPKWNPGTREGVAMRCKYTLPVAFRLK